MTDIRRSILWIVFSVSLVMLWDAWNTHNGHPSMFAPAVPKPVAASGAAPANTAPSAAGVPAAERQDILDTVAALPASVSVLLIEHDMDLVFSFANWITVLVNGAVLTEGPPQAIADDPRVRAVYLGETAVVRDGH